MLIKAQFASHRQAIRRKWSVFLMVTLLMQMLVWQNAFAGVLVLSGSGTAADPYQIATENDLAYVRNRINQGIVIKQGDLLSSDKASYCLTADIELTEAWIPIGIGEKEFSGVFDGQGHTISNLLIDSDVASGEYFAGLFGTLNGAEIKDLSIEVDGIGGHYTAGAVAGQAKLSVIHDVAVTADNTESLIANADIGEGASAGSLVGIAENSSLYNCSNNVDVASYYFGGGLIGWARGTVNVVNCSNQGDIEVMNDYGYGAGGGLIGSVDGDDNKLTIKNAYNGGSVSTDNATLGGILGYSAIATASNLVIENVYTVGVIDSVEYDFVGEIVGDVDELTLANSYYRPASALSLIGHPADHAYNSDTNDSSYPFTSSTSLLANLNAWTASNQSIEIGTDTVSFLTWAILSPDGYGYPEFDNTDDDEADDSAVVSTPRVPQKRDPHTLLTGQVGGIQTTDLAYLVAIPEQWMDSTAKVEFWLDAAAFTAKQEGYAYLGTAAATLKTAGATLLESYDVRLMKRVTGQDGMVSEGEVALEYVRGNLTSRLPIPAQLQNTAHLGLCWIDETGAVAFLESRRVTLDGVSYLEFTNNNFTTAYAFIADPNHAAVVG